MKKMISATTAVLLTLPFWSCSKGGGSGSLTPTSSSNSSSTSTSSAMTKVPAASGPVTSSSRSFNKSLNDREFVERLATTGVVLANAGHSVTFGSSDSPALCQTIGVVKNILRQVAQPDKILCYMKGMAANGVIPSDFADGNVHYIKLSNLPNQGSSDSNTTPMVKVQLSLTSSGALSSFTMYSCFAGTAAAPTQSEYVSVTNTSGTISLTSKSLNSSSSYGTYGSSTTATGTVDSTGAWTDSKTITSTNYNINGSNSFNMYMNFIQGASSFTMTGYNKGSFSFNGTSQTFSSALAVAAQLINASTLSTLAIGDGTALFNSTNTWGTNTWTSGNQTSSWTGDNKAILTPSTSGSFYSSASALTLPTIPSSITAITFTAGVDAWDCTLPSGATWTTADFSVGGSAMTTAMNSCNTQFDPGSDWVDCSSTFHN